jgi:hypothetical protein
MRKLLLICVLVAAALAGGIAYVLATDGDGGERRAGALSTGYNTGKIALQLDGAAVGYLTSAECGQVSAEVQRDAIVEGTKLIGDPKHIGPPRYEPCKLEIPWGNIDPAVSGWIAQALNGQATPRTLMVQYLDYDYKEKRRLEVLDAAITEVTMPGADAQDGKNAAQVRLTLAPQALRGLAGSGAVVTAPAGAKATSQLRSNFKFTWGSSSVLASEVGPWSFTIDPKTKRAQLSELPIAVSEADPKLPTLESSFNKFLIDGQSGDANETTAVLEWLDPTLKITQSTFSFSGVGWAKGNLLGRIPTGDSTPPGRDYSLYIERATITPPS